MAFLPQPGRARQNRSDLTPGGREGAGQHRHPARVSPACPASPSSCAPAAGPIPRMYSRLRLFACCLPVGHQALVSSRPPKHRRTCRPRPGRGRSSSRLRALLAPSVARAGWQGSCGVLSKDRATAFTCSAAQADPSSMANPACFAGPDRPRPAVSAGTPAANAPPDGQESAGMLPALCRSQRRRRTPTPPHTPTHSQEATCRFSEP